ncbi:MAG TPA: carbamoyltransferase [Candidatus Binatia bacterium]|nr:carbamoyltransferase [Candidatus Binatia bacterium]
MNILGISCFYHDSAAALLQNGTLTAAAEEERFSRLKHDSGYPTNAIRFCLENAKLKPADLDYVVFYEKPFVKFERILTTSLHTAPRSLNLFAHAMKNWLVDRLWVKALIQRELGVAADRILFSEHHLSHAASAFLCSPFDEAAVLTVDGVGEWATASSGIGKDNQISINKEIRFPHSLGLLYSVFTAFLGFEVNEGEYKVMGMAPYGQPRFVDKVEKLIRVERDGSFLLNLDYFSYHFSSTQAFNSKFEALFGPPRRPESYFFTSSSGYPSYFGKIPSNFDALARQNEYYADIAASIQVVTEEILLKMVRALHQETGQRRLCMAGGVALNSVANGRLLKETPFEEIYIQPAAGDSGAALGAALYAHHVLLGEPRRFVMEHAYWGQEFNGGAVHDALAAQSIHSEEFGDDEKLLDRCADLLSQGKVAGWFQGKFEWGPRALGHRSILADPRRPEMKDVVNTKIKFREPYRPFAPSVLEDRASEFFDLASPERHYPNRFMLYVVDVKDGAKPGLPAITHVDGSARLQTVRRDTSPLYYRLIEKFGEATGTPVLLNTSFNLRGEPIVTTPADALKTFYNSGLDFLVLGNRIIGKDS